MVVVVVDGWLVAGGDGADVVGDTSATVVETGTDVVVDASGIVVAGADVVVDGSGAGTTIGITVVVVTSVDGTDFGAEVVVAPVDGTVVVDCFGPRRSAAGGRDRSRSASDVVVVRPRGDGSWSWAGRAIATPDVITTNMMVSPTVNTPRLVRFAVSLIGASWLEVMSIRTGHCFGEAVVEAEIPWRLIRLALTQSVDTTPRVRRRYPFPGNEPCGPCVSPDIG